MFPLPLDAPPPSRPTPSPVTDPLPLIPSPARPPDLTHVPSRTTATGPDTEPEVLAEPSCAAARPGAFLPPRLRALLPARSAVNARRLRFALMLLPLVLLAVWAAVDWRTVQDGAVRLASADPRRPPSTGP